MYQQNNDPWVLPAGKVRFCRSHWVQSHIPLYRDEILQGIIELEDFEGLVRRWSIHVIQNQIKQYLLLEEIPINNAYWLVSDWTDEREFDRNGQEIDHISRQPLFNLNIKLEKI